MFIVAESKRGKLPRTLRAGSLLFISVFLFRNLNERCAANIAMQPRHLELPRIVILIAQITNPMHHETNCHS